MSLKQKTISGLFWTLGEQFASKGIGFVIQIILTRILMPEEFGLLAMIIIFIAIGNSLVESGMAQSIIRTHNPDKDDYSTVFYINVFLSIFIYLGLYYGAPLVAQFYGQEIITNLLRVYALTIIIQSFASVQITKLTKEMNFKFQTLVKIPSHIISGIVGIYLALNNWGVWSLVYMNLTQTFISTSIYWITTGWKPILAINRRKLYAHFNFGYKLTLSSLIHTIFTEIYSVIIGKYYAVSTLGFYNRANTLQLQIPNTITPAINKVTYPAFAEFQNDNAKLKSVFIKMIGLIYYIQIPITISLIILADEIFITLFTEKWLPAVPFFKILCFVGLLKPLHVLNMNILKVKGRSDLFLKLEIIKKSFLMIGLLLVANKGIITLLYFQVLYSIGALYINSFYTARILEYSIHAQIYELIKIALIGVPLGLLLSFIIYNINWKLEPILNIVIFTGIYLVLYITITWIINFKPLIHTINLINSFIKR